jgi:tellurite resistance protein TehA-like permease
LLVAVTAATIGHWLRHPDVARRHHRHPTMSHFYGALPMAVLTVGASTLVAGRHLIGMQAAVEVDWVCWAFGTVGGLTTFVAVPWLGFSRRQLMPAEAFGGWLMPVVPPLVSASAGALLVPHAPIGLREPLLIACYSFFALSLAATAVIAPLVVRRLLVHGPGAPAIVPTVWIVLGPLGQSVAAANLLAVAAARAHLGGIGLHHFGVDYGVAAWCLATLWVAVATTLTVRTFREGLPFALTWWSFTFPLGNYVVGSAALAAQTGAVVFRVASTAAFVVLLIAWTVVAGRTRDGVLSGQLLIA